MTSAGLYACLALAAVGCAIYAFLPRRRSPLAREAACVCCHELPREVETLCRRCFDDALPEDD